MAAEQPGALGRLRGLVAIRLGRSGVSPTMVTGAAWSIGGNVAGAAVSFVVQVMLARALDATDYGAYSYLIAWVNVAVLVGKLEFDTAALRFVSAYDGQRQDTLLHGFMRRGWRLVGGTATTIALVACAAAWVLRAHLPEDTAAGITAAAVLVPLSALLLFSSSALQGLQRIPQAQLPQLLLRPALFGLGIVFMGAGLGVEHTAGTAVAMNALATAVALGLSLILLHRALPPSAVAAPAAFETAKWMGAVRGFIVIAAAQLILSQQADILVVGSLLGSREAGLYSVASQLATLIGFGATAVIFVVIPVISDLYARGQREGLQRLVVRTVQGCIAVSIPVAVLLFAIGPLILSWYGPAFVDAYPVMAVLSAVQVLHATVGIIAGFLLTMTGHEWQASRVIVGTALLNLALTFILTPVFGAMGAAWATALAGLVKLALLQWYAQRYLGIAVLPLLRRPRP